MPDPEVDRDGFGKGVGPWVGAETVPAPEEGLPPSTVDFIVMELLEGQTVADRLEEGAIVGTFQYMSPEQIEGKEVDGRTDVWSPDGNWIYFASDRSGNFDIWRQRADLSGEAELVFAAPGDQSPIGVSGDWQCLYLIQMRPNNSDILRVRLDGTGEPEELAATDDDEAEGSLSPDGRFLAYSSLETDDWVRSAPSLLTPLAPGEAVQRFDLNEDGRRVLTIELARAEDALPSYVLRVGINWIDELRENST